jgi:UDP-glucose 4-epimerase
MNPSDILLLGGNGFIGNALAARLVRQGRKVHTLARFASRAAAQPGVQSHVGDLSDAGVLNSLLPQCGHVVHLATGTTPGTSARHPELERETLASTLSLLAILQQHTHVRLTYISSGGTLYGNPARSPVAEDAAIAPLSYHGAGKAAAEAFLQAYRASGGMVTVLRPSNTYGPGQAFSRGFGLVRAILQHMQDGSALEIWGDGESVRDFIYVDDVVDAIVLAMDAAKPGDIFNVGSGKGHTLNQVVSAAEKVCQKPLQVLRRPARIVDVRSVVLDVSRIGSALGWQPRTSLEEGLDRTWQWLRKQ